MKKIIGLFAIILLVAFGVSCSSDDNPKQEETETAARSGDEHKLVYNHVSDEIDYEALLKLDPDANIELLHEQMVLSLTNQVEQRYIKCSNSKYLGAGETVHTVVFDFGFAWCLTRKNYTASSYPCGAGMQEQCIGILAPGTEGTYYFTLGCNC